MAVQNGALLINRRRIIVPAGVSTDIDTGLRQQNRNFAPDPGLDGSDPPDAFTPGVPSRVMVVPLAPIDNWAGIVHHEPRFEPATGTVFVEFENPGLLDVELNVMFWDPHTAICPVSADTYLGPACEQCEFAGDAFTVSNQL